MARGCWIELQAKHVDRDVVVVPTEQGEIVGIVIAMVVAFLDVVGWSR